MFEFALRRRNRRLLTTCVGVLWLSVCYRFIFVENHAERRAAVVTTTTALNRIVPSFYCDRTPVRDVVDASSDMLGARIDVEWQQLERVGVVPDRPLTMRLRNVKVSTMLRAAISELDPDLQRIRWVVDDSGQVLITTRDACDRRTEVRYYDLRRFFVSASPGAWRSANWPRRAGESKTTSAAPQVSDSIVKAVRDTVDSGSSASNGGNVGTIRLDAGWLTVRQTPENHRKAQRLLEQFEARSLTSVSPPFVWLGERLRVER